MQKSQAAATSLVKIGGVNVLTDYGYPDAQSNSTNAILSTWVDISANDFELVAGGSSSTATATTPAVGTFAIIPATGTPTVDYSKAIATEASCHVLYKEATGANTPAVITAVTGAC